MALLFVEKFSLDSEKIDIPVKIATFVCMFNIDALFGSVLYWATILI